MKFGFENIFKGKDEELPSKSKRLSTIEEMRDLRINSYEEGEVPSDFFQDKIEQDELFHFSKKIAEYLHDENIADLVIIDRSSRPLYVGVKEYWKAKYQDEKMPNILFMNPKGFKAKEDLVPDEIFEIIEDCAWKEDASEGPEKVRSREEILADFRESYSRLLEDKDKPVAIFDTCIHSGDSLASVQKICKQNGFSDLRIGAINEADANSKVHTDFHITDIEPEKGCYPFDRDKMVEKTFSKVYSNKNNNPRKRARAIQLRREIKEIMLHYLEKDNQL